MKIQTEIDEHDDIIDSRDIEARIEHLEGIDEPDADETAELKELVELREECGASDWQYGEQLIRESYFTSFAQELAEDCCEMPKDLKWPFTCINWEQAARELKYDYSSVEFRGVTFYFRA